MIKSLLLALALGASAAAPGPAVAEDAPLLVGAANCRHAVPAGWSPRDVRWSGACRDGLAEGRGVLREFVGGKVARVYYGALQAGQLTLGVIEQPDGYVAGRFEAGKALRDGERSTFIKAFEEASAAAEQVAETYRKAGKTASARYYSGKARKLAQQMD